MYHSDAEEGEGRGRGYSPGLRRGQFQSLGEVEVVWEKDGMNCIVFLFQNTLQDDVGGHPSYLGLALHP